MTTQPIPSTTDDLIAEIELDFQSARKLGREAYIDMQDGEALIARIRELERELEQAQPWIPCSERLPDVETVVLGWWRDQGPLTVFWDGLHWGDAGDDIAIGYAITHWMPLPGKPQ
ncbi:MAG: DUF551 domain-containing protein [Pseudomonadota bacterium]|nr:DUF551 domain-containing protein [Pseudomonadota bacterium]